MVRALLLGLLCLASWPSFALPSDKDAVVHLRAGTASLNQRTHRGVYTGDVRLDQGSTHVRAAFAITNGNANNQLILAVAHGNATTQAHVWTRASLEKPPLHAYADTIRYIPLQHLIELLGHARLTQGHQSFAAPTIKYDTLLQHVTTQQNGRERTTIVIHPPSHS